MNNPVKRVAAVHDMSGFGRVSLTAVIPILSHMGIQVCPVPTAVLSTHSQYENFTFIDLTDHLMPFLDHWKKLNLSFDAIYSGFLGSHRQVEIVEDMIRHFKHDDMLVVVDPVLGDNGKIYGPLNEEMVTEMKRLIKQADLITPNLTEASFLLDKPYSTKISRETLKDWLLELSEKGPKTVIITSVPEPKSPRITSVIAYNKLHKRFWKVSCDYIPANYPGTGDSFTSVIVGSLLQGDSLPLALERAVQFISYGVRSTFGYDHDTREGILLERVLKQLHSPAGIISYQILDWE